MLHLLGVEPAFRLALDLDFAYTMRRDRVAGRFGLRDVA